ncbi:MAG: transcriptional regulator [Acidobacteria bacterium]|nr:MAG: transcriptional regulator [Acidobacteriota bacterium]
MRTVPPRPEPGENGGDAVRARAPQPRAGGESLARCPVQVTLDVMDDRWKTLIVWHLFWGARPFCELMRTTEGISKKILRRELADMERHGLIRRKARVGAARRAEYSLTPLGETLKPIVGAMYQWGLHHAARRVLTYGAGPLLG